MLTQNYIYGYPGGNWHFADPYRSRASIELAAVAVKGLNLRLPSYNRAQTLRQVSARRSSVERRNVCTYVSSAQRLAAP